MRLRLPGTNGAKINEKQTPLHASLNNSVPRPSFKNLSLRDVFFYQVAKVCLQFQGDP